MPIKKYHSANHVLDRVKYAYQMKYDSELADFLQKDPSTISTWRRRNTIDYHLIFSKCHDLNANYIIHGDMPIFREQIFKKQDIHQIQKSGSDYQNQNIIERIENLSLDADEKIELLKIYLKLLEQKQT